MKIDCSKKNIMLTGAGGPAMMGMINILKEWGYRVIAVDMQRFASGFFLADSAYVIPAGNDPKFLSCIMKICVSEKVDAVISVVDEELPHLYELESLGIMVIQPELNFVKFCLDKYRCMNDLRSMELNAPQTWMLEEIQNINDIYPLFIKPRFGRGSRGCKKVNSKAELDIFLSQTNYTPQQLLAQTFITGTEFTVSVVVWRNGVVQAVVPKEIISKVGVTKAAVTKYNLEIERLCKLIQEKFAANGPFNVQLILDKEGIPWVFEINPRFSTSITLTNACGLDELGGLLSQSLFGYESYSFQNWKEGIVLIRHTKDQFISLSEFEAVNSKLDYRL